MKHLLEVAASDVRSVTGSNLRCILRYTDVQVIPGVTRAAAVKEKCLDRIPCGDEWKVPLLYSLLAIREGDFVIPFDDEVDSDEDNEIMKEILENICIN